MIAGATPGPAALAAYGRDLEAGAPGKAAQIRPWLRLDPGGVVVDVGTATGAVAAGLARSLPGVEVVGTDVCGPLLDLARTGHAESPRLTFVRGAASERMVGGAGAVVMGAVLHEVFSAAGDRFAPVERCLAAAFRMLAPGGRLVIRDFVRPPDAARRVVLEHRVQDVRPGRSFADFAAESPRRVPLRAGHRRPGYARYETTLGASYEYVFRKDAGCLWQSELAECYGFWTARAAVRMVAGAGFEVLAAMAMPHRWVIEHRLRGRIRILDALTEAPLRLPARQLLLVAQRPR